MSIVFRAALPFLLFVLYDLNSVLWGICFIYKFFFLGLALIVFNTAAIIGNIGSLNTATVLFLIPAALFLFLLIYALFFALPFVETYVCASDPATVCKKGLYAMSRHPGAIFFFGFFVFLVLAFPHRDLAVFALVSNICNIGYIVLQDLWTFPRSIAGYDAYKTEVPFLIPSRDSFRNGLKTIKS